MVYTLSEDAKNKLKEMILRMRKRLIANQNKSGIT
jgi:hypothetical protein